MKTIVDIFKMLERVKKDGFSPILKISPEGWELSTEIGEIRGDTAESLSELTKNGKKESSDNPKDDESKPRGRPVDEEKRQHIIQLALCNNTLSMAAIAWHVGCSETLVANVFKDRQQWDKRDKRDNWRT